MNQYNAPYQPNSSVYLPSYLSLPCQPTWLESVFIGKGRKEEGKAKEKSWHESVWCCLWLLGFLPTSWAHPAPVWCGLSFPLILDWSCPSFLILLWTVNQSADLTHCLSVCRQPSNRLHTLFHQLLVELSLILAAAKLLNCIYDYVNRITGIK